ncbi:alpha/beta hydrolase family protein [Nocardia sp. NEAU-G5]|uniref:Alpha/beta hydrolase family protein n=1 Tax=Nocardia albiluteola TaxID=2842303 RepID=A0ABS6AXT1_9NOCA|nr:alpha/beta hydrolase [Nocardia albiluteola]MBU3062871.1 alpha/beta hydrolase family protein [Nocardia albiluteola]
MATVDQIRATNPEALLTTSKTLTTKNRTFSSILDQMRRGVDDTMSSWKGDGAAAASATSLANHLAGSALATAVDAQIEALGNAAAALGPARQTVVTYDDQAKAAGCTVAPDGHVTPPTIFRPITSPANPDLTTMVKLMAQAAADEQAREIESHLVPAVASFNELDAAAAIAISDASQAIAALAKNPNAEPLPASFQPLRAGLTLIFHAADPKQFHDWWVTLTPAEKDALAAADPAIGNIDGMPSVDRDHYNRLYLTQLQAQGGAGQDGYLAVAAALNDPHNPDPYLLHIDAQGHGAIALQNPDTAQYVATYVPGTGQELSKIHSGMGNSQHMLMAASGAPGSTSVVCWYGYNAPQSKLDATRSSYADAGVPALDSFQSGLRASHDGAPSFNTVVGHSYGTTLIGDAASHGRTLDADQVVLIASPGTTVDHASDLHLTGVPQDQVSQHVWATRAANDMVPVFSHTDGILGGGAAGGVLGWVVGGPVGASVLGYVGAHVGSHVDPEGPLGVDPAAGDFRGRKFASDPGPSGSWYEDGYSSAAHSHYFDINGNTPVRSLQNVGALITNQPNKVD